MTFTSLVPKPSHHPVFDRLQYAKILQAIKKWTMEGLGTRLVGNNIAGRHLTKANFERDSQRLVPPT